MQIRNKKVFYTLSESTILIKTKINLRPETKSVILIMITMLLFSVQDAIAKHLVQTYPPIQVVWSRYISQTLATFVILFPVITRVLITNNIKIQMVRSTFLFLATFCFFSSIKYLQLAQVNAIFQLAPLIVTILSFVLLKEAVGKRRWSGVAAGLTGALLIIRPGSSEFSLNMCLPALAAMSYASYLVTTKYLSKNESPATNFLYTSLIGAIISSILVPSTWIPIAPGDLFVFGTFGLLGALGHLLIILAFRLIDASFLAPFTYMQLIFGTLWGYLFFFEIPSHFTLLGSLLIISAGIFVWQREKQLKKY